MNLQLDTYYTGLILICISNFYANLQNSEKFPDLLRNWVKYEKQDHAIENQVTLQEGYHHYW